MELLIDNRLPEEAELREWQTVEFSCLPPAGAWLELRVGAVSLEPFLRPGEAAWRWRWNPQNAVGAHEVRLTARWPDGRTETGGYRLVVKPRKLDAERYARLLEELERAGRRLLRALSGPLVGAQAGAREAADLDELLAMLFGANVAPFARAVERIGRRPPGRVRPLIEQVEPGQARDFSQIERARWAGSGGAEPQTEGPPGLAAELWPLMRSLESLPETHAAPVYGAYEYGLTVRVLGELQRRADELLAWPQLPAAGRTQLLAAHERLRGLRSLPGLAAIGELRRFQGPSALLQRDPDFRIVYRMWLQLRRRPQLALEKPLFDLPVSELPRLYEYWCLVVVAQALLELAGWQVAEQALASRNDEGDLQLTLVEDQPLLELHAGDGTRLRLRYQPRYRPLQPGEQQPLIGSLDRHTRVPDIALELLRPGAAPALLVFDAKYRLDVTGGLPEEALADGYVYLGSLGDRQGRRVVRGTWLFYPGHGPGEQYGSGIGARPLLPGDETAATWLAGLLAPTGLLW